MFCLFVSFTYLKPICPQCIAVSEVLNISKYHNQNQNFYQKSKSYFKIT